MRKILSCLCALVLLSLMCARTTLTAEPANLLGDLNADSAVDSVDARLLLQITVGSRNANGWESFKGDVHADGRLDSVDARRILQISVGAADLMTYEVSRMEDVRSVSFYMTSNVPVPPPQLYVCETQWELLAFFEDTTYLLYPGSGDPVKTFDEAFFKDNVAVITTHFCGPQAGTVFYTDHTLLLNLTHDLTSHSHPTGVEMGIIGVPKVLLEGRTLYG